MTSSPTANSSESPGRNGNSSPHSTNIDRRGDPEQLVAELVEQPLGVHPLDAEQQRGDQGGESVTPRTIDGRTRPAASPSLRRRGSDDEPRAPYDPMPHGPAEVGVGPWAGRVARPARQYDARLLAEGDRRNVVDRYRYWTVEAIVADLDTRRHAFHVAIENWQHDFNIGTIVRTANAFLAARGAHRRQPPLEPPRRDGHRPLPARPAPPRRRRPRRPTCTRSGVHAARHRQPARARGRWRPSTCRARSACSSARRARASREAARAACDGTFSIAQFGSTRSINASAAAAIAMHAWVAAARRPAGTRVAWRG